MKNYHAHWISWLALVAFTAFLAPWIACAQHHAPPPPKSVRLYVFDCGSLDISDPERFRLTKEELATTNMSVGCYLIAHPKGNLMWDVGVIPDGALQPGASSAKQGYATITKPLKPQLAAAGYSPSDINYLVLSHYHYDHIANSNDYAGATWLVRQVERDAMFAPQPPARVDPATYDKLKNSKTVIIGASDDYDVFGDGTVVIKFAPGHTPGHQVLFVKLAKTGPVVLSGDLYHYPEERKLKRVPTFETNQEQTAASRESIEAFVKKSGAHLWIQHDFIGDSKLKKAPQFYE
jgi:N-acyl homoserine lactone hydrolase